MATDEATEMSAEREAFEQWLGREDCPVHYDESANKNAWYGWQAGAEHFLAAARDEQVSNLLRMLDERRNKLTACEAELRAAREREQRLREALERIANWNPREEAKKAQGIMPPPNSQIIARNALREEGKTCAPSKRS